MIKEIAKSTIFNHNYANSTKYKNLFSKRILAKISKKHKKKLLEVRKISNLTEKFSKYQQNEVIIFVKKAKFENMMVENAKFWLYGD